MFQRQWLWIVPLGGLMGFGLIAIVVSLFQGVTSPEPQAAENAPSIIDIPSEQDFGGGFGSQIDVSPDGRKIVYDHTFEYSGSSSFRFADWTNDDAQSFRNELDRAYETITDEIVQALFDVKIDRPGSRPPYGPPDDVVEPPSIGAIRTSCWAQNDSEPSDHPVIGGRENLSPSEDLYVRCVARRLAIWGVE